MRRFPVTIQILVIVCALCTNACATLTRGHYQRIRIQSEPPGAHVMIFPSRKEVETPADIKLRRDTALTLFVQKEGYRSTR